MRKRLEALAQRAADAVLCGRLELLTPLAVLIDALDDLDASTADLEDGHDAESITLTTPSQWKLTFGHRGNYPLGDLPPDVPGYARKRKYPLHRGAEVVLHHGAEGES